VDVVAQLSTTPNSGNGDSEPKSRAPNWRSSPGTSAEPGISTAVEGIWEEEEESGSLTDPHRSPISTKPTLEEGGTLRLWPLS